MSKMIIQVKVTGIAQTRRALADMRARAQNNISAWQAFLDWFAHENRVQFGTRGARWGTPWDALSPNYLKRKRADGWMGDTLVREGNLLRSLADRPMGIERMDQKSVTAGTKDKPARYHQLGTKRVPKRELFNARAVARTGVPQLAVRSWILTGRARTR
jgi:hypothetical protein